MNLRLETFSHSEEVREQTWLQVLKSHSVGLHHAQEIRKRMSCPAVRACWLLLVNLIWNCDARPLRLSEAFAEKVVYVRGSACSPTEPLSIWCGCTKTCEGHNLFSQRF